MTLSPVEPSMTSTPELTGRAVGPGFTLPHNTTRTMADVLADEDAERRKRDRAIVRQTTYRPTYLASKGKVPFAGHDKSEVQFRGR